MVTLIRVDTLEFPNLAPPISIVIAWMAAILGATIWYGMWKCPRCRKHFTRRGLVGNAWARRCMNCHHPQMGFE